MEGIRHQPRERGLADPGRPPEDHRMGLARLERNPQRLVRTQHKLLADYFVDIAGAQSLSERDIGTGFFKPGVLWIISAFRAWLGNMTRTHHDTRPAGETAGAQSAALCCFMTVTAPRRAGSV